MRLRRLPGWQWTELSLLCLRGQEMCEEKAWWGLVLTFSKKEQTEGNCSASVLHDLDYLDCKVLLYSQIRVQIFYSYLPLYK